MRGKCPYHHDVLIFYDMLALYHVRYFQIIKLYFRILMVSRLKEHLNMINLFNKQIWLKYVRRNIILLHLVLLPVFYLIFGKTIKVCKDNCGD